MAENKPSKEKPVHTFKKQWKTDKKTYMPGETLEAGASEKLVTFLKDRKFI